MISGGHESASQRVLGLSSPAARNRCRRGFLFNRAARTLESFNAETEQAAGAQGELVNG
jgi:hypothetical protein